VQEPTEEGKLIYRYVFHFVGASGPGKVDRNFRRAETLNGITKFREFQWDNDHEAHERGDNFVWARSGSCHSCAACKAGRRGPRQCANAHICGDLVRHQIYYKGEYVPRMTRAQLQQQARDFATEAVVGDFIAFQVPGDVNIAYVVGKVDSGLAVLEHTTNTLGGNVQGGTDVLWFKQMRAVQPGSFVFSLVDGPAYPVDIGNIIGVRVALQPVDARLRAGAAVRYRLQPEEHQMILANMDAA